MKIPVQDILATHPKVLHFVGKEPFLREILVRLTTGDPPPLTGLKLADDISADVTLTRDGRTVFVEGIAHAAIHPPCARCLKAVPTMLDPQINLSLLPAPAEQSEDQLNEDEMDEYSYANDEIDVGAILNEQLLLEKPIKILCNEDCKGLCPSCGSDLNEGTCACVAPPKSLAFAALKDFKPRN